MAEILHQFKGSLLLIGFHTSQVVQDFSHQLQKFFARMFFSPSTGEQNRTEDLQCLCSCCGVLHFQDGTLFAFVVGCGCEGHEHNGGWAAMSDLRRNPQGINHLVPKTHRFAQRWEVETKTGFLGRFWAALCGKLKMVKAFSDGFLETLSLGFFLSRILANFGGIP